MSCDAIWAALDTHECISCRGEKANWNAGVWMHAVVCVSVWMVVVIYRSTIGVAQTLIQI